MLCKAERRRRRYDKRAGGEGKGKYVAKKGGNEKNDDEGKDAKCKKGKGAHIKNDGEKGKECAVNTTTTEEGREILRILF